MTIEFSCEHCGKALSTGDEKAGRRAKCPDCGEAIEVPWINTAGVDLSAVPAPPPLPTAIAPAVPGAANCPMCGFAVSRRDQECPACGEPLTHEQASRQRRVDGEPDKVDLGVALSRTWELYKAEFGLVVGSQIVGGLLAMAAMLPAMGLFVGVIAVADQSHGEDVPLIAGLGIVGAICGIVGWLTAIWIGVGMSMILLRVVRGETTSFSTLFEGGRYFWRAALCTFLFQIMANLGYQMCVIPYFIVMIFFWPYQYILIDDDSANIQALLNSPKWTSKSGLTFLALMIVSGGIVILGVLALGIGLLFAMPFVGLLWCVAYDQIRGGSSGLVNDAIDGLPTGEPV